MLALTLDDPSGRGDQHLVKVQLPIAMVTDSMKPLQVRLERFVSDNRRQRFGEFSDRSLPSDRHDPQ